MSTANKRATNVQVPGEEQKKPEAEKPGETQQAQGAGGAGAEQDPGEGGAAPAIDLDALREQIRAEEQAKLRAELSEQIQAAKGEIKAAESVATKPAARPLGRRDYLSMNADDIDPASLTAPVRTKDGWLCPPAPEAKK
jgi:hypothetical protein